MDLHGNTFHGATVECNFSFADVIENEKEELYDRLLNVYFKDEPTICGILEDEEKWEAFFAELLDDDDATDSFEEHFYRQLTHRYAGTLYGKTTVKPQKIVRQIALFVGTYYIAHYIKSQETQLSQELKFKCSNTMLKVEIRALGKDLERRDDLCDDLMNEIFRHEKKIDEKSEDNDKLILKNKSRLAKINILKEELKKIADPPKGNNSASRSSTPAKSTSGKTGKGEKSQGKKKGAEKERQKCSDSTETSDNEEK